MRLIDREGEPWFVLADVCRVLAITNSRNAAARLDDDEKGVHQADTPGGKQNLTIINEPGMYRLVLRSDKPAAKRFQKWVVKDVLPSIRKTGAYRAKEAGEVDLQALLSGDIGSLDPAQLAVLAALLLQKQSRAGASGGELGELMKALTGEITHLSEQMRFLRYKVSDLNDKMGRYAPQRW